MAEGNHPSTRAQESSLSFRSDDHGAVGCGCNICFEIPKDPVTPVCRHLYCRPCILELLQGDSKRFAVCRELIIIEEGHVRPIYGRTVTPTDTLPLLEDNLVDCVKGLLVRRGFALIASANVGNFGVCAGSFGDGEEEGRFNRGTLKNFVWKR
ncbi:hypothetical protein ACS0TY_029262 [Phlomoides rotata]